MGAPLSLRILFQRQRPRLQQQNQQQQQQPRQQLLLPQPKLQRQQKRSGLTAPFRLDYVVGVLIRLQSYKTQIGTTKM